MKSSLYNFVPVCVKHNVNFTTCKLFMSQVHFKKIEDGL